MEHVVVVLGWEMRDLVGWTRHCQGPGVQPLEKPFEDLWSLFWKADGLVEAFCESGVEGSGEEGAGGRQEFLVDQVGDGRAGSILLIADDHGGHCAECAEGCTKGHFCRRATWTRACDGGPCSGSGALVR